MSSSDWVALGSLIVSCFAFVVSYVGYKLQQKTAKSDNEKELADQIAAIQDKLAEPNQVAQPTFLAGAQTQADSQNAIAKATSTNAALQMLVLRVGNLIESTGVQPDWYQNLVLASAAVRIGDQVMAEPYVKAAADLAARPGERGWSAETAATAQMLSLQVRANFFYNRGEPGDVEAARTDLEQARQRVRNLRHQQGPNMTAARLAEFYVREADFELDLGHEEPAADRMANACKEWLKVHTPTAQQAIGNMIWSLVNAHGRVPFDTLLTAEFVKAWGEFLRGAAGSAAPASGAAGSGSAASGSAASGAAGSGSAASGAAASGAAGSGSAGPGPARLGPDDLVPFTFARPAGEAAPVTPVGPDPQADQP